MYRIPSRKNLLVPGLLAVLFLLQSALGMERSCRAGYWIVSTYSMCQQPGTCPKHLNFKYYYKPNCGRMKRVSCSQMQSSLNPSAPTCIMVHGSYVGLDVAIKDANNTYGWLRNGSPGCPLNVIFFVWPSGKSEIGGLAFGVRRGGNRAAQNGIYLGHLIDRIPASSPLSLMGHSHGARVVAASLHYRAGGRVHGVCKGNRSGGKRPLRVVFAAAAINHDWLNPKNRYGRALTQVDSLLNIINRRDLALAAYPLATIDYRRSIAKTGLTRSDRKQLGCSACKVHELVASSVIGFRHTWPNYYGRPELAKIISPYVFFNTRQSYGAGQQAETNSESAEDESSVTKIDLPEPSELQRNPTDNKESEQDRIADSNQPPVIPSAVAQEPTVTK